ncbi:unnamed protein product [Arabidopsis halleri]
MASQTQLRLIIYDTQKLHSFVTKSKLSRDPYFATQLVRFYALNDDLLSARKLFDVFLERTYAKTHQFSTSLSLFSQMLSSDTRPDNFTYACLARGFSESFDTEGLRRIHGIAVVFGLGFDQICGSAIVKAYSNAGLIVEASKLFCSIPDPDFALWNVMILGYGCCGF